MLFYNKAVNQINSKPPQKMIILLTFRENIHQIFADP